MSSPDTMLGTVIDGRYRLREFIGSGSYGNVFAADELTLGRVISEVAVKIITPESPEQRKSVLMEILGLARLTHDYIITYRSSGEVRDGALTGSIFLATELGDTTLADIVRNTERVPEDEFRELVRGVTLALGHIHAAGAIHGDVKPANIIRVKGRWKLGDLGLIRSSRRKPSGPAYGSLTYMAPEMLRQEFSPACDVYALGATILWYFTGRYAYDTDSREEFVECLQTKPPVVPEYLREPWRGLVTRCLQRDPGARPTAEQILAAVASTGKLSALADTDRAAVVVAPAGRGHYESLREAVEKSPAGTRIYVHPGKYREPLRIDRPVEIVGDGKPEDIVLSVRDGHCVEIVTTRPVLIRGLTMRVRPGPLGVEGYGLDVGQGRPVIKDCVIQSLSLACVAVHDGADPTLRRCQIMGSRDAGVFVYDGGRGTFESCDIFSNGASGITVSDGGEALFKGCKVYDNKSGGAAVFKGGAATFEECRFLSNGRAGVTVAGRAALRGCRVADNAAEAIVLKDGSRVAVTGCDLRGNAAGPWRIPMVCELDRADNQEE